MTKTVALLLGAGFVAVVIGIVLLYKIIFDGEGPDPEPKTQHVEITAPNGTRVFVRLPGESERLLGVLNEVPLVLKVEVGASVILRHENKEKSFSPETWENGKIIWCPEPPAPEPIPPRVVSVSINAVPWAKVFIKLPGTDRFIEPPEKKSNVTPIRGGLKVPVGTTIRLVYGDAEKTIDYGAWKTSKSISHDFLNP